MVLFQSPLATGLFHRGIEHSAAWQDASQFQHSSGEAAMSLSRECMVALGCSSVECVRKSSAEDLVTKCNMMVNAGKFIPTVGAIFTGYDGDVLQRPLLSDLCSGSVAAN